MLFRGSLGLPLESATVNTENMMAARTMLGEPPAKPAKSHRHASTSTPRPQRAALRFPSHTKDFVKIQ